MTDGADDERVRVATYVPRWQKDRWADHAASLDMSQSEFLRSMVQAGRRGFEFDDDGEDGTTTTETGLRAVTPGVDGLEDRVLAVLREDPYLDWDELVEGLNANFEAELDDALESLQRENAVTYSGRHGGYAVVDDGD